MEDRLPPNSIIDEPELLALCAAIQSRIDEVRAHAINASNELESIRLSVLAEVGAHVDDAVLRAINSRCSELNEGVLHAEATKVAALEMELVTADAFLIRLQDLQRIDNGGLIIVQAELFAQYGPLPLEPAEPAKLQIPYLHANPRYRTRACHQRRQCLSSQQYVLPEVLSNTKSPSAYNPRRVSSGQELALCSRLFYFGLAVP